MNKLLIKVCAIAQTFKGKNKAILRITAIAASALIVIWLVLRFSPYPELKEFQSRPYSVRYYDRAGMLLQITPLTDGLRREKQNDYPQHVKDVFVFSEDRRFYNHFGVDLLSLFRALYQNVSSGRRVSGASTITMQTARIIADNGQPPRNQSVFQKLIEMFNALRLETRFSKDEILKMYLDSVPFGFSTEGAASAARTFFASEISALSPSQIFCLAVIPRRPSFYNPLENPENCIAAASALQERFAADKSLARKWPLFAQIDHGGWEFAANSARRFSYPFELPHLIRYISANTPPPPDGEVHLTIDLALQNYLERTIAASVRMYYSLRITNGAALVIDNETGEILAWTGSAEFFNEDAAGQVDGVLALNQPGSAMKPFLYAMALDNGYSPSDVLADIPVSFGETEIYIPRNFDERFNGPVLLRTALASSLNIPAVSLLERVGVRNYSELLFSLGFDSIRQSIEDPGLGLALGNAPVSLLELVRAFSVFPRDGVYLPLTWDLQRGNSVGGQERRIFSVDAARIICSILSDSAARTLAFGAGRNFVTQVPVIFKTGTANQFQSIVALGATTKYTIGVWMGNFTGETIFRNTGSSVPAVIARDTLNLLHGNYRDYSDFPAPANWQLRRICAVSGMEPANGCLSVINEYVRQSAARELCTWHVVVNGRSETLYPAEYQAWFNSTMRQGSIFYASRPLEIINPRDGIVYLPSRGIGINEIPVEVIGGGSDLLHVTHNGRSFTVSRPFIFNLERIPGVNVLRVQSGGEDAEITFTVSQ